jgi:hypothetical protein
LDDDHEEQIVNELMNAIKGSGKMRGEDSTRKSEENSELGSLN